MSNAHLSDQAIIGKINSPHGNFDARSDALVMLKNAGVNDKVIVQQYLATVTSDFSKVMLDGDLSSEH